MLEDVGYKIIATTSSREAWDLLRKYQKSFDLVISDMTMPEMTGIELAQKYLAISSDPKIIISTDF